MGLGLLSRRAGVLLVCGLAAGLVMLVSGSSASAAAVSAGSLESAGVREALSHEVQPAGPGIVSQGGSGGTGGAAAPAGEVDPSLSTAFSTTWSAPHRPLVTRIFNVPVNYKGSDGSWHTIDNALVASPLGGYENTANSFSLQLPESLSSDVSLSYQGSMVSFTLQGASATLPAVSGDTASYPEVLSSTDLSYTSEAAGVRELVTLKNAAAPTQLRYALSLPVGFSPHEEADGSVALVDGAGEVVFTIPAATAYRPSAGPGSGRVLPSSVAASGSGWTLTVDTGEAWLREELGSGAVAVDPSVDVAAAQACSLAAESPTTSKCSSSELRVGYDSTHQENHALLEFSLSSLPTAAVVLDAKLGLYVQAHSTTSAKAVGVYRVTKPWTTSATWNTYDGTHSWGTAGGDYSNPEHESDASVNPSVGASTGWSYWYPTKMVQEWVNTTKAPEYEKKPQGYANEGLIVKDQTDSQTANLLTIDSPSASSDQPYLEVSYQARGQGEEPQYTIASTPLSDTSTMGVNVASGDLLLQSSQMQMTGVAGFGFTSTRTWNGLNGERLDYGHWEDSNDISLFENGDGSVSYLSPSGAWFEFQKQPAGEYTRPPGIKATMCGAGSPSPCPTSLPSGVSHELLFDGNQGQVSFNAYGAGIREDHYGHKVSVEFPSEHHLVFTDPQGHKIEQISEGLEGLQSELKDLSGSRNVKFAYKNFGEGEPELQTYTDENGKTTSYEYSNYTITKITDGHGEVTLFHYDSKRRVEEIIRTTNAEHTKGPTTKFKYYAPGEAPSPCTSNQRGTVVKDPDWETTKAHEILYCSNVLDQVEKTVAYNGEEKLESSTTYDPFGNQTSLTAATSGGTEKGGVTSLDFDKYGINLECTVQGTTKEESKCPARTEKSAMLLTSLSYADKENGTSPTQVENPESNSTSGCYNFGTPRTGCPEGATGPAGSLATETDALSKENELKFEYNKEKGVLEGTLKSSSDAKNHTTTYEYDEKGNLKTVTPPSGSGLYKTTITVDSDSRPHTITQCLVESCISSDVETISYDKVGRVTEAVYTGPGATKTFKYVYNADGDLEELSDPAGNTTYTYDALNRLTEEVQGNGPSSTYGYDAASNLTSFYDAAGTTIYLYNGLNQLEAMHEPTGSCTGTPSKCTRFAYENGTLDKITYPSGATLNYTLDAATKRPTAITVKNAAGETLLTNTYAYEHEGADTTLIYQDKYTQGTTSNTTEYEYNPLEQLKEATTKGSNESYYFYEVDGAGNRVRQKVNPTGSTGGTETFYDYNGGNELECRMKAKEVCSKSSSSELAGYSYDGVGNETAITGYSETGNTSFSYDNLQQLKDITPPSSSEQALTYLTGGQGNLITVGAIDLQNTKLGLTAQINESGTSAYARTPEGLMVDERLPGGNDYNPVYDANGDIIGLLSSSGALVQTIRYGPYGENTSAAGSLAYDTTNDPFQFQGGYHLPENEGKPDNLYHYGARFYEPATGRWIQQDPASGSEPYTFASDDPINEVDPTGEMGMAGSEKTAAESTVRWCVQHPHEFYYNRAIYERCKKAGEKANLPEDNCHVAGTFLFLLGGTDVLPAAANRVLWLLGGGQLAGC
jgi:RHS repeat-associated protein